MCTTVVFRGQRLETVGQLGAALGVAVHSLWENDDLCENHCLCSANVERAFTDAGLSVATTEDCGDSIVEELLPE